MLSRYPKVGLVRKGTPYRPFGLSSLVLAGLVLGLAFGLSGCTRSFYRKQTDTDVNILYSQKDDKLWKIAWANVYPDPRSRFADPSRPDRPPMPPDDPAAKALSPNPQKPGKKTGIWYMEGTGYLDMLKKYDEYNRNLLGVRKKQQEDEEETKNGKDGKEDKGSYPQQPGKMTSFLFLDGTGYLDWLKTNPQWPDKTTGFLFLDGTGSPDMLKRDDTGAQNIRLVSYQGDSTTATATSSTIKYSDPRGDERLRSIIDADLTDPITTCKAIEVPEDQRVNKRHPFLINLEQSIELAYLNSRELQARRESLYLAALPVTQERFALGPQGSFFGSDFLNKYGNEASGGPVRQWSNQTVAGISQVFCWGAQLLVNFANQTVYNFGQLPSTSISTLSFDFVEPFLRGAGFAVTLEPLTQAERNLLYEIRDFYKFRQDFFVFIAAGQSAFIPGVQPGVIALSPGTVATPLAPQVVAQAPLPGTLAILPGAIGAPLVATQVVPGSATVLGTIPPPGATTQGFLSTIYEKANLVVTYQNIDAVRRFKQIFDVYLDGGIVGLAQVNQVEQQLLSSREAALNAQVSYRVSLDQFKFQLGIPQCIDLDLADEQLEPMFKLIRQLDRLSKDQQNLTDDSSLLSGKTDSKELRELYRKLSGGTDFPGINDLTKELRQLYRKLLETAPLTKGTKAVPSIQKRLEEWKELSNKPPPINETTDRYRREQQQLLEEKAAILRRAGSELKGNLSATDQRKLDQLQERLDWLEDELLSPLDRKFNKLRRTRRKLLEKKDRDPENKLNEADQQLLQQTQIDLQIGNFERFLSQAVNRSWEMLGSQERETNEQLRTRLEQLQNERGLLREKRFRTQTPLIAVSAIGQAALPSAPWPVGWLAETFFPAEQRRLVDVELEIARLVQILELRTYQENGIRSGLHRSFLAVVEEAFNERQKAISDSWPCLPVVCAGGVDLLSAPEDIALTAMQKVALDRRVDLMNYRGQVVDAWREITVAANGLLGLLNLQYHGDFSSPGYHPLAVGGSNYHQQLIINWNLPIVRIVQRNLYRASLINFQAARRQLMAAEDDVLFGVRIDMRNVRAFGNNFHLIQKRAIVLAYQQVDVALQAFSQPQIPTGPQAPQGSVGPPSAITSTGDPAALTIQLLNAQTRLLNAQTDLYNTWIGYQINRMDLYRDMGLMPLDKRGVWLDEESTCDCGPRIPKPGPSLDQSEQGGSKQSSPEQLSQPRKFPEQLPEQLPGPRKLPEPGKLPEPRKLPPDLPSPGQTLE